MHIVPDILPHLDPTAEVRLAFGRRKVQPGDFVDSTVSETPPRLDVQVFDKGVRLVTIIVLDPDVPNLESDGFDTRCHFFAADVPISPNSTSAILSRPSKTMQVVRPWLPPHAQKGSPYHRLVVLIYEQKDGTKMKEDLRREISRAVDKGKKVNWFMRYLEGHPIGVHLFRTIWDDGMAGVMQRAKIEGANIELKRQKPEKLPYKKKDGGRYR